MSNIISVSRRTDIPTYYGDWFLSKVMEGSVWVPHPVNNNISLKPENVRCFVFWSKNYAPFLPVINELKDNYTSLFHYTITGLPSYYEPHTNLDQNIDTLKKIADIHSPKHISWRYDPVVVSNATDKEFHLENFYYIASKLKGYVERCHLKFALHRPNVIAFNECKKDQNLIIKDLSKDEKREIAFELADIAKVNGITVFNCTENIDDDINIFKGACIDTSIINTIVGTPLQSIKKIGTRPNCNCIKSIDIGKRNTCQGGCVYCYATSMKKINKHYFDMTQKSTKSPESPKMKIIYEPAGKAKEYSPLASNLYSGCTHGCAYCYVPLATRTDRKKFHETVTPVKDALKKLEVDAKEMAVQKDDREILLSFSCDPYPIIEAEQNITRQTIEILKKHKLRFTILTKAGKRAEKDFGLLKGYEKCSFGTTLIFANQKDADKWEPNAAPIQERIDTIKEAKKLGIKTWVSLEPVINPEQALALIENLSPFVDHWKVGKINYNKEIEDKVDWLKFREDVRNLLRSKAPDKKKPEKYYYLKRSLTAKHKIEVIHGKRSNVLLVAPHGVYGDDDNTGEIVRAVAKNLDCHAVINEYFQKPELDKNDKEIPDAKNKRLNLNRLDQMKSSAEAKTNYLAPIKEITRKITDKGDKAIVVWLHGIGDESIKEYVKQYTFGRKPDILIGHGQGATTGKQTATATMTSKMETALTDPSSGIVALPAQIGSKYCAADPQNLTRLFLQPGYKNIAVNSIQLEIKYTGFRNYQNINKTAKSLAHAITALSEPVVEAIQEINIPDIKCKTAEDRKYIYREANFKDKKLAKQHEIKIKSLADSIQNGSLLQPIGVMRQKKKYILLYGYRRYLAVKSLGRSTITAQVYDENNLPELKRLLISITENGERQDLNAADIADCLLAIKNQTSLNDEEIAKEYSNHLRIGNSGKTINKYLQLANIKKSSPKIIEALRKKEISFGVATDILATISDVKERNLFFEKIVLPFRFPRPSLQTVKKYLEGIGPGLTKALTQKTVKDAISESLKAHPPWKTLLTRLGTIARNPEIEKQVALAESILNLKKKVFGKDQLQDNLSVSGTSQEAGNKEITLQIKLTVENYTDMLKKIEELAAEGKNIKAILDKL